jgi:hypothetical protein
MLVLDTWSLAKNNLKKAGLTRLVGTNCRIASPRSARFQRAGYAASCCVSPPSERARLGRSTPNKHSQPTFAQKPPAKILPLSTKL